MARPLLMQHEVGFFPAALASFLTVAAVFSLVVFLCGAHQGMIDSVMGREKTRTVRLGGDNSKKSVKEKVRSGLRMISWRKVDGGGGGGLEEDGVVWKKTIIRGEKCRPLDFSGQILYDADGKLLNDLYVDSIEGKECWQSSFSILKMS